MRGSCFNSQFFDSEIGKSSAESEIMRGKWFSGRQVKIVSQNKHRVCCSSVDSVQGSCFNSQFFNSKNSYNSVANEDVCGMWIPGG